MTVADDQSPYKIVYAYFEWSLVTAMKPNVK